MKTQSIFAALTAGMLLALAAAPVVADSCQQLETLVSKSRSFSDLQRQGKALKLSANDMRRCRNALSNNQKLHQLLSREKQRVSRNTRSRQQSIQRRHKTPEQLTINRRALQLRTQAKTRLGNLQRMARPVPNNVRLKRPANSRPGPAAQPSPPRVTRITPSTLVPGTDVVIEGENFGDNTGTVTLRLQGKTFNATINAWNDTWVNAYLSDSIGGVMPSDNAVIQVQLPQQNPLNHNIPFIPLYVQKSASDEYDSPGSLIFPGSGTTTVFLGKALNNGWSVTDFAVSAEPTFGECELGTPSMSVGNDRLESQLKWSYDWWEGFAWCYVDVYVEGPQGTSSGL